MKGGLCHDGLHRKRWVAFDGADHTGVDVFLRCTNCTLRTATYIECADVSGAVRKMLDAEWAAGRTTREAIVR